MIEQNLREELAEAEHKAWDSLSRYRFLMFGYWAANWVLLRRVSGFRLSNPFISLVMRARERLNELGEKEEKEEND